MLQEKNLEDMVNFTGRVLDEELLDILSTADVCVNPDKPCEMNDISTMIKIMEYMALGKPIVQFDLNEGRFSAQDASLYSDIIIRFLISLPRSSGSSTTLTRKKMGEFGPQELELNWRGSTPSKISLRLTNVLLKRKPFDYFF